MNFDEFCDEVKNNILSHLPESYAGAEVYVQSRQMVNHIVTGLSVVPEGVDQSIIPTIYLEGFYEGQYQRGKTMDEVLDGVAATVDRAFDGLKNGQVPFDKDPMSQLNNDKLYFELINTESNRSLLSNVPHREFKDMSLIYRVLFDKSDEGVSSVIVTHDLASSLDMSEQELYDRAYLKTKELFPAKISTLNEIMMGFLGEDVMDAMGMNDGPQLYLVTNDVCVNGATCMVYDDVLQELTDRVGENVYILPSSLHEFLAAPESMCDSGELTDMVFSVNRNHVNQEDRLSNNVFYHDAEKHELSQVSDQARGISDDDFRNKQEQQNDESEDMNEFEELPFARRAGHGR